MALRDFVADHFLFPMLFVLMLFSIGIWEWFAYARHLPRQPGLITGVAFGGLVTAGIYWRLMWKKAFALKLGRDGERVVGQLLVRYSEPDAIVFHDLPSSHGNIDHVVNCSRGIYAIETKTRTKPAKGKPVVSVEDERLAVNGLVTDRDPIAQARACADEALNRAFRKPRYKQS